MKALIPMMLTLAASTSIAAPPTTPLDAAALAAQQHEQAVPVYDRARRAEASRRFPEALSAYAEVARIAPDDAMAGEALAVRALLLEQMTEFEDARDAFIALDAWASAHPQVVVLMGKEALRNAGSLTAALGEYERASDLFLQWTRLHPSAPDANAVRFEAARSMERAGKPEAALALFVLAAESATPVPHAAPRRARSSPTRRPRRVRRPRCAPRRVPCSSGCCAAWVLLSARARGPC